MLSFFPRGVLDEILNLIESVSEGFPSYPFQRNATCKIALGHQIYCLLLCREAGLEKEVVSSRKSDRIQELNQRAQKAPKEGK